MLYMLKFRVIHARFLIKFFFRILGSQIFLMYLIINIYYYCLRLPIFGAIFEFYLEKGNLIYPLLSLPIFGTS